MDKLKFAETLIAEADADGSSRKVGGSWLWTQAILVADQKTWDDRDPSKETDFTTSLYWIVTDGGQDPDGVDDASDDNLRFWSNQYADDIDE